MNMDRDERALPLSSTGSPLRRRLPSPCATAQKEPFFPTFLTPGEEEDEHEQQIPAETCAESKVFPHNIVSYGGKHVPIAFAGKHAVKDLAASMPEQEEATSVDKRDECANNDFAGSPPQLLQESLETSNSLSDSDNAEEDELVGLNEGSCCTDTDCGDKEGNCGNSNDARFDVDAELSTRPFKDEENDAHNDGSGCDRGRVQLTVFRARNCAELRSGPHIQVPTPLVRRIAPQSKDGSFRGLDSIEHDRRGDMLLKKGDGPKNHVSNLNSASENKGGVKEFSRSKCSGFVVATSTCSRGDDTETCDSDGETSSSSSSSASSTGGRGLFLDAMPSDAGVSESEVSSNDEDGDSEESSNEEESDDGQDVDGDSEEVEIEQDSSQESSSCKSQYEGDSETTSDSDDEDECQSGANPSVNRSSTDELLQRESSTIEIELQNALQDEEDMEFSSGELNHSRRSDSLTQEEVEELMYQSKKEVQESDLVFSDNEEKVPLRRCSNALEVNSFGVSDKELVDLVSGALQFDCWSSRSLSTAVSILSSLCPGAGGGSASHPISIPPSALTSFWLDELLFALSSQAQQYLLLHPSLRPRASEIVHGVFLTEMSHLDLALVDLSNVAGRAEKLTENKHLYVGSMQSLESRLGLAMFGIKRIVSVADHPPDELWSKDGVQYSTHAMRNLASDTCDAAALCNAVYTAAHEVASSLAKGDKVLVTCPTGNDHACAVCAAYLITKFGFDLDSAIDKIRNCRPSAKVDRSWLEKSILVNKEAQKEITPETCSEESQKAKRVLSCQMLSRLSLMPSLSSLGESPKRQRSTSSRNDKAPVAEQGLPDLPTFTLGPAAMDRAVQARLSIRLPGNEDSSTDNDAIEELEEFGRNSSGEGESSPVPLLTPPESPRQLQPTCETPSVCEWPSNIVVDSAITSAIALPPLSPKSLQRKEEELGCKEASFEPLLTPRVDHGQQQNMSTGLTPRLGGISVAYRSPTS